MMIFLGVFNSVKRFRIKLVFLTLISLFIFPIVSFGYDQVKVNKVLPLAQKKSAPSILRMDSDQNFWILNLKTKSIHKISSEGRTDAILKPTKSKSGGFKTVKDFVFHKDGTLWVSDPGNNQVIQFKKSDKKGWKKPEVVQHFPVAEPGMMAISHDDIVAVMSEKEKRIHVYSIDGVLLHVLFPPATHEFKKITGLAFAKNGTLWVVDQSERRIHRFNNKRKWLAPIQGLNSPQMIAVDDYGFAYITSGKGKWYEIDHKGKLTGSFGTKGTKPGQMKTPIGVAINDSHQLWVAEKGTGRIQIFDITNQQKEMKTIFEPAARLQIRRISSWPTEVDEAIFRNNGDILLFKAKSRSFEWIDDQGNTVSTFGNKGKGMFGFSKPTSPTLDSGGQLWVVDSGEHAIKKISETGEIVKVVGKKGRKPGGLLDPVKLKVRVDGSFVVVDKGQSRVQVLAPEGLFLFSVGKKGDKKGQYKTVTGLALNHERIALMDNERKALLFFDQNGKFISEIANKEGKPPVWSELVDIETDGKGRFYILDKGAGRVRVFSGLGKFIADLYLTGDDISLGLNGRVLIKGKKNVHVYQIDIVPKKIKDLKASDQEGIVHINWKPCDSCVAYRVYRSSPNADFRLIVSTHDPLVKDELVFPGTPYTYAVRGVSLMNYEGNWTVTKPVKPSRRKDISLVSIGEVSFKPIFTAAYKSYVKKPIGTVEVQNNDDRPYRNVKLSLSLKRYTDYATEKTLKDLEAGERRLVPITLTFNDKVLELTENTPIQVDLKASYFQDNEQKSVSKNVPLTLYSRNAINWKNKARISSFITPRDTPIVEFSRKGIKNFLEPLKGSTVGKPLAKAALFYEAMNALDIAYVPDPTTPFAEAAGNPEILDYIQFPRETLRRKTGDCDDTTALMASLLGSIGVDVALVDTPGHIFLMADLNESDPDVIGLPEERFVEYQGTFWVPIETTKLGQDFLAAWQAGISQAKAGIEKKEIEFIPVIEASEKFSPVTLVEKEKEKVPFPKEKVEASFRIVMEKLQRERYDSQIKKIRDMIKQDPTNDMLQIRLGMAHVEGGKPGVGKKLFLSYVNNPSVEVQAAAQNNLGNLAYLEGKYKEAKKRYADANILSPDDGGIIINRARTAWRLGEKKNAMKFLYEARDIMPDWRAYTADIPAELMPK